MSKDCEQTMHRKEITNDYQTHKRTHFNLHSKVNLKWDYHEALLWPIWFAKIQKANCIFFLQRLMIYSMGQSLIAEDMLLRRKQKQTLLPSWRLYSEGRQKKHDGSKFNNNFSIDQFDHIYQNYKCTYSSIK